MISSYSFLLLDDPPGTITVVSGIEAVLIYFVGQISRLDGPVGGPLIYATGGSGLASLLDLLGGGIAVAGSEGLFQLESKRARRPSVIIK